MSLNPQIFFTNPNAKSVGDAITRVFDEHLSESDRQRVLQVLRRGLTKLMRAAAAEYKKGQA